MTREEKQKAIDALKISAPVMAVTQEEFKDYIQSLNKIMDWLEQDPTTKHNLGVDCISRTRAIERLKLNFPISQGADNSRDRHRYMQALADLQAIKELPSVTPQPRKGHWINKQHLLSSCSAECSSCQKRSNGYVFDNGFSLESKFYDFCPNCGCAMVEPQESEDKE